MSLYRDLWGTGKDGLLKFISGVVVTGATRLESIAGQLKSVDTSTKGIAKAIEDLFSTPGYALRISYSDGRKNSHIELTNEGGEVRFNRFVFEYKKEG